MSDNSLCLAFGNVFANHIKLQIDLISGLELVEVGVFVGIRDNGHTATVFGYIKNSQAGSVDTQRSFFDNEILVFGRKLKVKQPTAALVFNANTFSNLVNMTLYQMPIEAIAEFHGAFQIDFSAYRPHAQCRFLKGLMHSGYRIDIVLDIHHGQTHPIVRQTLIDFELFCQGASNMEMEIVLFLFHLDKLAHRFDYPCKHRIEFV